MEANAIDFTERILNKRFDKFVNSPIDMFFDTSKNTMKDYFQILFQSSMNVPRIIGYILSYCFESRINFQHKINKSDIESASERYYNEKIHPFFETTTHSLISFEEKVSVLQLQKLLYLFIAKSKDIKKRITTEELKGLIYVKNEPFSSHFHFDPRYEAFLKTLELNFFINKYNNMSDKDGLPVSIYCLNYGLCKKEKIFWGKPIGGKYRKYFIERPFIYNKLISDFLSMLKRTICINTECRKQFNEDEIGFLEFNKYKCNECGSPVITEVLDNGVKEIINKIEESQMFPVVEVKILRELQGRETNYYAREIAEEIDLSKNVVAARAKKLSEKHKLVKRSKKQGCPYKYELTKEGKEYFTGN